MEDFKLVCAEGNVAAAKAAARRLGIDMSMVRADLDELLFMACCRRNTKMIRWLVDLLELMSPEDPYSHGVRMLRWLCADKQIDMARWVCRTFKLSQAEGARDIGNLALLAVCSDGRGCCCGMIRWLASKFNLMEEDNVPAQYEVLRVACARGNLCASQCVLQVFNFDAEGLLEHGVLQWEKGANTAMYYVATELGADPAHIAPPNEGNLVDALAKGCLRVVRLILDHFGETLRSSDIDQHKLIYTICRRDSAEGAQLIADYGLLVELSRSELLRAVRAAYEIGSKRVAQWFVDRFEILEEEFKGRLPDGIHPSTGTMVKSASKLF